MELANLIFAVYLVDSLLYTGVKNLDEQNLLLECTFPELPYRMKVLRGVNFEDYFKDSLSTTMQCARLFMF